MTRLILFFYLLISYTLWGQVPTTSISVQDTSKVNKITDSLSPKFYKVRYNETDLLHKITDNFGNNFEDLYGTRNMRPILHGIAYRGGGNNYYHKTDKRKNQNPLPPDGVLNLCKEGFSKSVYLYQRNADSIIDNTGCNCINGKNNNLEYVQLDYFDPNHIREMVKMVHKSATQDSVGPVYLHCWNGWHASGYISAILLKQFCGYSNLEATSYWDIATDGANQSPRYRTIRKQINDFVPFKEFKLVDGMGEKICPPMPKIIDSADIHLEIEHLVVVPEAIPLNYRLILYEVKFGPGQTSITNPENNADLQKLLEALEKSAELKLEIGGHTDRSGSEAKNKELSKQRAKFVYDFLIKKGISADQITYKGFGSSFPAFSNKYKSGRENNRRIEVKIIQKKDFGSENLVDESAYEEDFTTPKELNHHYHNKLKQNERFVLDRLTFEPNSTVITDSLNEDLLQMLRYFNANPTIKAEIGGFTDNSGIPEKNDSLSLERAKSVYSYFVENGIVKSRLSYNGYGDKNPIAPNRQRWGRDKNRRIEIKITEI